MSSPPEHPSSDLAASPSTPVTPEPAAPGAAEAARPTSSHGEARPGDGSAHAAAEHEGSDEGGGDDDATEAQGGDRSATGDGAPGTDAAGPKKRRRRRRKKGGAPGQGVAAGGEGETGEAAGAPVEGSDVAPQGEGAAPRERPARGPGQGKPKKGERRERPPQEHRFLRERPAFGVGDVVFGKIIEITDDAVFVDLSGKARGIFDRHEMLLPDEPAEDPNADKADDEDHDDDAGADSPDADAEHGTEHAGHGAEARSGEAAAPGDSSSDVTIALARPDDAAPEAERDTSPGEATPAPAGGDDEKPSDAGGSADRRIAGRRIIVAAAAKAVDAPPSEAPPASVVDASAPTVPETQAADAVAAEPDPAAPVHEAPAAPRPAPYAPPIVLEVGAHFVGLVHNDGSRGGLIVLTRHPRRVRASKLAASAACHDKSLISGLVTGVVRGGVEVDVDGLRAFAPGSHLDLRPGADLRPLVGRRLQFLVTQYGKRGRDVVLSRRPMLESEAKAHRAEALERVQVGAVVPGLVKSVVPFGAFLDIGGVEGLVTLQEMSHNRGDAPHDVFRVGETVDVRIIRMDDKGKIWLSRKSAIPDPWDDALKKYAVGTRHAGKVVRLQPFGAFVELEPGIDGLIHVGDLSVKPIEHPSDVVKVGDAIDVVVAQTDPVSHKIGLHPAPTGAAADEAPQRVQMHKPVKVQVMAIEPGGLVVRILGATGRHSRGYITAMATGTARGTELRKPFPVGMTFDAKVIEMDPRRGEIKLSIKALHEDTERNAYQQYRQQVTREAKFGTFGDLLAKKDAGK